MISPQLVSQISATCQNFSFNIDCPCNQKTRSHKTNNSVRKDNMPDYPSFFASMVSSYRRPRTMENDLLNGYGCFLGDMNVR